MTQPSGKDVVSKVAGAVGGMFGGGGSSAAPTYGTKSGTLKQALAALQGMMPDPDTYNGDAVSYQDDLTSWMTLMTGASDALAQQQAADWGYVTLPDGSMMPTGDLTPEQRSVFEQANNAKYQETLNSLGLTQAKLVEDRAQADFQNKLSRITAAGNLDDTRLRKSEADISRALSGKGESRDRASLIANTKLQAAPYATQGGKTSFSANDLGSLLGEYSAFAGVDPNSSLLNYQGTSMVDPEADMQRFDSLLGVGGALPGTPSLLSGTDGFGIPDAPDLGALPQLSAPGRVNLSSLLSQPDTSAGAGVASKVTGSVNALLAKILGAGGGAAQQGGTVSAPSFANPSSFNPVANQLTPSMVDSYNSGWKSRLGVTN